MEQQMINLAKRIYLKIPSLSFRAFLFHIFRKLVKKRIVQTSVDGINYKLDLGEVIDLAIFLNRYEPDLTAALQKLCLPGFFVLDIGANIGAHTLRLARVVGENGRVYAFEPTDYAYRKLVQNISLNSFKNIFPLKIALSDRNLSSQSIRFRSSWPTNGKPVERESTVDFKRLDDWFRLQNLDHVDLIKLDVDGNESSVLMGAESLLTRQHPPILMEVWGPNFLDDSRNPYGILKDLGYRFFHISTGKEYFSVDDLKAVVSSPDGVLLDFSINIIAN